MKYKFQIKEDLYKVCEENIEKRLSTILKTLNSIEEARSGETKSSVGDKHETGRAMMQLEEEKLRRQLFEINLVKNEFLKIDRKKSFEKVEIGSLVTTNRGDFYISIGIGKITLGDRLYFCVSVSSPIGGKLLGKVAGDAIDFNGNKITIEGIN